MVEHIRTTELFGCKITIDDELGSLAVEHHGDLSWDRLFQIKNIIWGPEARAVEVYPRRSEIVNNKQCRHLWRLGANDFCPDLLGPRADDDSLHARFTRSWAWAEVGG